jgi:oligopeptide transport system substrate-binding protein
MRRRSFVGLLAATGVGAMQAAAAAADASSARVLRRSRGGNLTSLDPHRAISAADMEIVADLFVGLTAVDARGAIVPGCARDWTVSADGRRWEFRLRPGLVWSDGKSLVAADFVASMRRMLTPATGALLAYRYDAIRGARVLREGGDASAALGVSAPAADRVVFDLDHPETDLAKLLAVAYVVPMHAVQALGREWAKPPAMVVNGAYRPTAWAQNGTLTLEANPRWFDAARKPVPQLEWRMGIDDATRLRSFRAGELDVAQISDGSQWAIARRELGSALHSVPFYGGGWVGLNVRRPSIADRRLRRALDLMIDRAVLCDKVRASGERPTYSLVPDAVADYPQHAAPEYADWPRARRVAEAMQLAQQAGVSRAAPRELVAIFSSNGVTERMFLALNAMWAPLGVRVAARGLESRAYNLALNAGDFDLMDYGSFSAVQSAASFIGRFRSTSFLNYFGYRDAAVDRAIDLAESQADPRERARLYLEVERSLLRDLPALPLYSGVAHRLVASRVRGWVPNSGLSLPSQFLQLA